MSVALISITNISQLQDNYSYIMTSNNNNQAVIVDPAESNSILHYIEKKMNVKYRFNKIFNGKIKIKNKYKVIKVKYYVGKRNVNYKFKDNLARK